MGIMVYSLLRVMQDFVHQPYEPLNFSLLEIFVSGIWRGLRESWFGFQSLWVWGCAQ